MGATLICAAFATGGIFQRHSDNPMPRGYSIPIIDLAHETDRQVVVDREAGQYLGHPTTVLLEDGRTILCVYPKGHGKGAIVYKRSRDGGKTWSQRLPTPKSWETSLETPTLYRTVDKKGKKRLILFSGLYPIRMAVSEDDGGTWSELRPIGDYGGIVAMGSVERLKNGDYVALFHDDGRFFRNAGKTDGVFRLFQVKSSDGGLTWAEPEQIYESSEIYLCEPGILRSPSGKQLAILLRENRRKRNSHVMFSDDEANTWSSPKELPGALTADRHVARYAPDGRLFITFRDTTLESPTKGDWVGWVGTYDDILKGREGQYRIRLMDNKVRQDCAYPGLELLPDGTFVTTTYGHWSESESPYIVSVRFKLNELDEKAKIAARAPPARRPNIIYIMADDLGYAELGRYGQTKIRTPNIDRMAAEGIRFTQFYSGSPVCAPSRCALITGKHPGRMTIRNNSEVQPEGQRPIRDSDVTIAELLKGKGYATACIGKWGLGYPNSEGDPLKQGFDTFFGYNCQRHAHNHYPTYIRRNSDRIPLEGNPGGATGKQHTHDLMEAEVLRFIEENRARPFFLYVPFTIPHVALQVPEDSLAEYRGKWDDLPYTGAKGYQPHPHPRAAYAAMVTRMDRTVGRVLEKLKKLGLEKDTLVVFTSDNGPTHGGVGGSDSAFFESAGPLRGLKGSVYEGGIRVPFIARWPGRINPGRVSATAAANWDVLPTLCDLAGVEIPRDADGISLLPALLESGVQRAHEYLYWEFPAYGGQQAVRLGDWKAVRQNLARGQIKTELYNLREDIAESMDVAARNPDVLKRMEQIMREAHTPSPTFPLIPIDSPARSPQNDQ